MKCRPLIPPPGSVCQHGSLARKCEICLRDADIAELKAKLAEANADPNDIDLVSPPPENVDTFKMVPVAEWEKLTKCEKDRRNILDLVKFAIRNHDRSLCGGPKKCDTCAAKLGLLLILDQEGDDLPTAAYIDAVRPTTEDHKNVQRLLAHTIRESADRLRIIEEVARVVDFKYPSECRDFLAQRVKDAIEVARQMARDHDTDESTIRTLLAEFDVPQPEGELMTVELVERAAEALTQARADRDVLAAEVRRLWKGSKLIDGMYFSDALDRAGGGA